MKETELYSLGCFENFSANISDLFTSKTSQRQIDPAWLLKTSQRAAMWWGAHWGCIIGVLKTRLIIQCWVLIWFTFSGSIHHMGGERNEKGKPIAEHCNATEKKKHYMGGSRLKSIQRYLRSFRRQLTDMLFYFLIMKFRTECILYIQGRFGMNTFLWCAAKLKASL